MGTLLIDRTTNQPRSVHSGRGGKSIAYDSWEAKLPPTSRLHRTAGYPPPSWQGTVSSAQHPGAALERLVHRRFVIPEEPDGLMIEERQDLRQIHACHPRSRVDPEKRVG